MNDAVVTLSVLPTQHGQQQKMK